MANRVRAKKSFGQHFLVDPNIAEKIARSIPDSSIPLLEIGPGMGMLTRYLINRPNELKLVELDLESVRYLREQYPEFPPDHLIYNDFLKLNLETLFIQPFGIVGNFPYNISSQILFRMLECRHQIPMLCGMFQKEVAQRIVSPHGTSDYGILSVLIQTWYDAKLLFTVNNKVFAPPPKVQSAVILLTRKNPGPRIDDPILFTRIVKAAFNQRRKMLKNPLESIFHVQPITKFGHMRAEQLSIQDFILLYNELKTQLL
jgi:16S rRNA (adenine1518-N6/adenine1519-N6)-dimethyltransferase